MNFTGSLRNALFTIFVPSNIVNTINFLLVDVLVVHLVRFCIPAYASVLRPALLRGERLEVNEKWWLPGAISVPTRRRAMRALPLFVSFILIGLAALADLGLVGTTQLKQLLIQQPYKSVLDYDGIYRPLDKNGQMAEAHTMLNGRKPLFINTDGII